MIVSSEQASPADIADHYDELDWVYREIWGEHVHHGLWETGTERPETAVRQLVRHVADLASIGRGGTVCDVGCGYGATARLLVEEIGARVTGITLSRSQYDYAMARRDDDTNPAYILGDWLDNDLPAASFDVVIAIESVEHMTDKAACFREAFRVLGPGGSFVFSTWLAGETARPWEKRRLLEPICREGRLPGIGSATEYRELLQASGFRLESFEDLTARVRRTWSICIRRVLGRLGRDARYRRFLWSRESRNRVFALTLLRMWLATRTGALRYGVFACTRPSEPAR